MTKLRALGALALGTALAVAPARAGEKPKGKIPVTTASAEARKLYLDGRAAAEALRFDEARALQGRAVEKDPGFALAHLALAQSAASAREAFESTARAVKLAGAVTEGERAMILLQDAFVRGDARAQEEHVRRLVALFPEDERALSLLGNFHFGRQEYEAAVQAYRKAIAVAPGHAFAYNQLGYALRLLGRKAEAEKAFERYVALVPGEPNPYDSHAELLLEMGRFEDAIAAYRRALAVDPRFVASFVGIANARMFMGRGDEARATLGKLRAVARNDGELRQAAFWTAVSWLHEGRTEEALGAMREEYAIAEKTGDAASMAQDLVTMGQIRLHAGRHAEALADFGRAVEVVEGGEVPEGVKENVRRNHLFFEAWTALERGDLADAKERTESYRARAERAGIPFEIRRVHELSGHLALAEKDHARAVAELARANQQDPYVLTLLAKACEGAGDQERARATWRAVADWNRLSFPWAFVRREAREKASASG